MCEDISVDFDVTKISNDTSVEFDNIVIRPHDYESIMKEALESDTGCSLGAIKIVTCEYLPDDCIALRSGDKIVAIVNLAKDNSNVG
jgi:hypothetical protein